MPTSQKYMGHQPDCELSPDAAPEDGGHIDINTSRDPIPPSTSHGDELACSLQNCLSVFQSGSIKGIIAEDLTFCEPSENDDPNTPPPLESHAAMNANFLKYQGWIATLFFDTDKVECGGLEHCELIKKQLLGSLQDEWNKLKDIKLHAWKRYSGARKACVVPPLVPPRLAQIVDTCVSFVCVPV